MAGALVGQLERLTLGGPCQVRLRLIMWPVASAAQHMAASKSQCQILVFRQVHGSTQGCRFAQRVSLPGLQQVLNYAATPPPPFPKATLCGHGLVPAAL